MWSHNLLFGISGGEILILLLLILLLFGPRKIPEIARMIGKGMNEVRKVQREINSEIQRYGSEIDSEPDTAYRADKVKQKASDDQDMAAEPVDTNKGADDSGHDRNQNQSQNQDQDQDQDEDLPYPYGSKAKDQE